MKQLVIVLAFLMVGAVVVSPVVSAQEQSDYEVIQGFKLKLNDIQKAIEKASTVQECVDIATRIDDLEKEYAANVTLLDKALYPDGYKGRITTVRTQLKLSQDKLGIIETQFARITDLEAQVKTLTDKVDKLTGENADLLQQVQKMGEAVKGAGAGKNMIDSLNRVINRLRNNIKDRDAMIFALVDSLFLQYDKSVTSMKDVEKQSLAGRLERRNVFSNIRKSIEDNIAFLQTTSLTSKDLVQMINEQKRFASQWKAFGAKLQGLYQPGNKGANQVKDVDALIDDWGKRADATFWRGLNLAFQERGMAVKPFNSGTDFKTNLIDFINGEIKNAGTDKKEESFKLYTSFHDSLWVTELKPAWIPLLVDSGRISDADRQEIESQVDHWGSAVSPSRLWIYLLILVVVLVTAYVMFRRKTPPAVAEAPKP
ncbi:MAG TPA: hypothetical protein VI758_09430 [Bacteroidota bacterium]